MGYSVNTFGNVVTETYDELGVDSDSGAPGLTQTEMETWANRYSAFFVEKCKMKTQESTTGYRVVADQTLSAEAAKGATTLSLTAATGMSATGLVSVGGIPMTYTLSGTTLTVTATDKLFEAGTTVQIGYAVPTYFGKPVSLSVDDQRYELEKWGRNIKIPQRHYCVYNGYIVLPESLTADQDIILHYYKRATDTLTTGDNMNIYKMWDSFVIFKGVARGHKLLYNFSIAKEYENEAKEVLRAAKQMMAEEDISEHRGFTLDW